jgi:exosortase
MLPIQGTARWIPRPTVLLAWLFLIGVFVCAYVSPIAGVVRRWWNEPDYVYGFLVPVFALVLLWLRRDRIQPWTGKGSWWGIPFLALCAAMRWASTYFGFELTDPLSIVPCLAGIVLLIGGRQALGWAWPSIVFLVFAIPLPGFLAGLLSHPLQRIGTIVSTYTVQTLGIFAVADGNVIKLKDAEVGVVEACSGLRMLMLFITVSVGAAFLMRRSVMEKTLVVLSAVPIAVVANVARITVTCLLHEIASPELAGAVFHDLAGWFMMPLAVVLLWAEMALVARLIVKPAKGPLPIAVSSVGDSPKVSSSVATKQAKRRRGRQARSPSRSKHGG